MTPREQEAFQAGLVLGALAIAVEMRAPLAEISGRLDRLERDSKPPPRPRIYLTRAGWRDGRPVYFAARSA